MLVDIYSSFISEDERDIGGKVGAIAKNAVKSGVTHLIATTPSHSIYNNTHLWSSYNNKLREENIPLTIIEGMEMQLEENMSVDQFIPMVGSNKYLLVHLPGDKVPANTQHIFYNIQVTGWIPIIAHPELNKEIMLNPNILFNLVSKGALVQLNGESILGLDGLIIKRFSKKLIRHNLVHFVVTNKREKFSSSITVTDAYKVIQKKFSKNVANYLKRNSEHMVNGTDFHVMDPIQF